MKSMNSLLYKENEKIYNILLTLLVGSLYTYDIKIIILCFCIFLSCVYFFRVPPTILYTSNNFMSPCYGVVSNIIETNSYIEVSIFLSIFDVHVQYVPCDCVLINTYLKPGKFEMAQLYEKTKNNERRIWNMRSSIYGDFVIEQVAGFIARTIVTFIPTNPNVELYGGTQLGMIRFGSRVSVKIKKQPNLKLLVHQGQYVKGLNTPMFSLYS